jgi:hypothetical protein
MMIATIETPHSLNTGSPGLIRFNKDGIAYKVIQNCSPNFKWIDWNEAMGYAKHHTETDKSEKLDGKFVANFLKLCVNKCYVSFGHELCYVSFGHELGTQARKGQFIKLD